MSNYVLGNIDGHMLPAVVHRNGVAYHGGENGGKPLDQVLITFFSPVSFILLILARSFGSQYGPFFSERPKL